MDACVAFGFLFNAESTKKSIGPKSLAQETQVGCSISFMLLVLELGLSHVSSLNFFVFPAFFSFICCEL